MNSTIKGSLFGIISAITYGLNPLGALNLYSEGVNVDSVLFYRYGLAMILLAVIMLLQKESFRVSFKALRLCAILGVIFAVASIGLFTSFNYIDSGVACTLFFIYPVVVAITMVVFFKEKITLIVAGSIVLTLIGIIFLYYDGSSITLNTLGVMLVILSASAYGIYMVIVNKSGVSLSPIKLTFYVMLFGVIATVIHSFFSVDYHLQRLTTTTQWQWALMLAVVPTIISLVLMTFAINCIGPTPTAIMGAFEPITAVIIGVVIFDEQFTLQIMLGILLIIVAVLLVTVEKKLTQKILKGKQWVT